MLQGVLVALAATLIYLESRIGGQHMLDRPILIGPIVRSSSVRWSVSSWATQ